jgi:cytochrome b subunit of formate dehydrogenase
LERAVCTGFGAHLRRRGDIDRALARRHVITQRVQSRTGRVSAMQTMLIVLMVLAALATLGVLIRGIVIMASGKDVTGVQSNKMMSYRVAFQALAIIFVIILFALNRH